jgi:hypothetical protein
VIYKIKLYVQMFVKHIIQITKEMSRTFIWFNEVMQKYFKDKFWIFLISEPSRARSHYYRGSE